MEITKSKRTAMISRDERGDWEVKIGRFTAVLPATGPEVETAPEWVTKLVGKLLSRERHKPTEPGKFDYKNSSGEWRGRFTPLDGEESATVWPVAMKYGYRAEGNHPTVWAVFCDSARCRDTELRTPEIERWRRAEPCVALVNWDDFHDGGVVSTRTTEVAEQAAYGARDAHIAWHRENASRSSAGRVELDRWIYENAMIAAPEPDRAEIDRQLAIARSEQKECGS